MKRIFIIIGFCLLTVISYAQVGIGTTTPDASSALDITAANSGLLIPRVSLVNVTNGTTPIATPATSLLVWNTNATVAGGNGVGYYYWDSATWVPFFGGANTLDDAYDEGGPGVGRIIYATDGDFQVSSGRVEFTHANEATGVMGSGVLEISNSLRLDGNEVITNTGTELFLQNGNNGDFSVDNTTLFVDASTNRVGIGNFIPNANLDARGSAIFNDDGGNFDFRIESDDDANMFFLNGGTNTVGIGTVSPSARLDVKSYTNTRAMLVEKFSGTQEAMFIRQQGTGRSLTVTADNDNHGVVVSSNNVYCDLGWATQIGVWDLTDGTTGINAASSKIGVEGKADYNNVSTVNDKMGGLFYVAGYNGTATYTIPALAAVGSIIDNVAYKILGYGAVSTLVKDTTGEERIMVAPEAPEALFQDYGTGQLSNGKAIMKLDPILTKNILVDEQHPLKVFVQLEGDCNGVYVTKKTAYGFEVVELNNGVSNTKFSYQIIANRADEERGGLVSKYSEMRFKPLNRKFVENKERVQIPEEKTEEEAETTEKAKVNDTERTVDEQ